MRNIAAVNQTLDMSTETESRCRNCGATLTREMPKCWLCGRDSAGAQLLQFDDENPYASPVAVEADNPRGFSLQTLMLFVTLVSVVLGISSIWPGVGIALGVFVFIPFLRTVMLVRARAEKGRRTPWIQRLAWGATSALIILAMVALTGVAAVIAFFFACWVAVFSTQGLDSDAATIMFFGVLAVCALGTAVGFGYWIRYRWRREIDAK